MTNKRTGVFYGLPLYGVLEAAGLEVLMVNGRQTRNLPGRKTGHEGLQLQPIFAGTFLDETVDFFDDGLDGLGARK